MADEVAAKIAAIRALDVEVGIVIGAGNLWADAMAGTWYGPSDGGPQWDAGDGHECVALGDALERQGITTRVQTAIEMRWIAEPYIRLRAIRHMEKGVSSILVRARAIHISPRIGRCTAGHGNWCQSFGKGYQSGWYL
jgi:uridylate kinase